MRMGVYGFIGTSNHNNTLKSTAQEFNMPFISLGAPPSNRTDDFMVYMQPSTEDAVFDLVDYYSCNEAIYVFDEGDFSGQ